MIGKPDGEVTERPILGISGTKASDAKLSKNDKSSGLALSSHEELCSLLYYLRQGPSTNVLAAIVGHKPETLRKAMEVWAQKQISRKAVSWLCSWYMASFSV
jgi:hypothetical protein